MNLKVFLKSKLLLLSVAVVWTFFICVCLPLQLPITVARFVIKNDKLKRYVWGWWIWQDQAVNAIHGGNPDVTVSSKVGYMAEKGSKTAQAMAIVIDFIFLVAVGQKNHCQVSIERDEEHY